MTVKGKTFALALAAATGVLAGPTQAQAAEPLRICAAQDELPFSARSGSGFENRIARIVAEGMGRQPEFVWVDEPGIYLVPDYLNKDKCDVITGVDAGDPRVATTEAYYRSSYVFIYPQDGPVKVTDWDSPDLARMTRFAVSPYSPVEPKLRDMNKWDDNLNYMYSLIGFKSRRNEYVRYDPEKMISEVVDGHADIAILWGPEAARYVEVADQPLAMKVVPDTHTRREQRLEFSYAQAMAVRSEDTELRDALDKALKAKHGEIQAVLAEEGFPLLDVNTSSPSSGDQTDTKGASS
ncbi:methanol oxidation system protein MoxJ [Salinisphaera sp. T31B1]|uniref:methanol oxidation system protein MoxJ n=1 Tax=Salinisphaera sp. T31B1 TaxID=727963 RepID=UPI00333F10BC